MISEEQKELECDIDVEVIYKKPKTRKKLLYETDKDNRSKLFDLIGEIFGEEEEEKITETSIMVNGRKLRNTKNVSVDKNDNIYNISINEQTEKIEEPKPKSVKKQRTEDESNIRSLKAFGLNLFKRNTSDLRKKQIQIKQQQKKYKEYKKLKETERNKIFKEYSDKMEDKLEKLGIDVKSDKKSFFKPKTLNKVFEGVFQKTLLKGLGLDEKLKEYLKVIFQSDTINKALNKSKEVDPIKRRRQNIEDVKKVIEEELEKYVDSSDLVVIGELLSQFIDDNIDVIISEFSDSMIQDAQKINTLNNKIKQYEKELKQLPPPPKIFQKQKLDIKAGNSNEFDVPTVFKLSTKPIELVTPKQTFNILDLQDLKFGNIQIPYSEELNIDQNKVQVEKQEPIIDITSDMLKLPPLETNTPLKLSIDHDLSNLLSETDQFKITSMDGKFTIDQASEFIYVDQFDYIQPTHPEYTLHSFNNETFKFNQIESLNLTGRIEDISLETTDYRKIDLPEFDLEPISIFDIKPFKFEFDNQKTIDMNIEQNDYQNLYLIGKEQPSTNKLFTINLNPLKLNKISFKFDVEKTYDFQKLNDTPIKFFSQEELTLPKLTSFDKPKFIDIKIEKFDPTLTPSENVRKEKDIILPELQNDKYKSIDYNIMESFDYSFFKTPNNLSISGENIETPIDTKFDFDFINYDYSLLDQDLNVPSIDVNHRLNYFESDVVKPYKTTKFINDDMFIDNMISISEEVNINLKEYKPDQISKYIYPTEIKPIDYDIYLDDIKFVDFIPEQQTKVPTLSLQEVNDEISPFDYKFETDELQPYKIEQLKLPEFELSTPIIENKNDFIMDFKTPSIEREKKVDNKEEVIKISKPKQIEETPILDWFNQYNKQNKTDNDLDKRKYYDMLFKKEQNKQNMKFTLDNDSLNERYISEDDETISFLEQFVKSNDQDWERASEFISQYHNIVIDGFSQILSGLEKTGQVKTTKNGVDLGAVINVVSKIASKA